MIKTILHSHWESENFAFTIPRFAYGVNIGKYIHDRANCSGEVSEECDYSYTNRRYRTWLRIWEKERKREYNKFDWDRRGGKNGAASSRRVQNSAGIPGVSSPMGNNEDSASFITTCSSIPDLTSRAPTSGIYPGSSATPSHAFARERDVAYPRHPPSVSLSNHPAATRVPHTSTPHDPLFSAGSDRRLSPTPETLSVIASRGTGLDVVRKVSCAERVRVNIYIYINVYIYVCIIYIYLCMCVCAHVYDRYTGEDLRRTRWVLVACTNGELGLTDISLAFKGTGSMMDSEFQGSRKRYLKFLYNAFKPFGK